MKESSSSMPGLHGVGHHTITLSGTEEEISRVRGMLQGNIWMTCKDEKVVIVDSFKAIPEPVDDPMIPPKWQTEFGSIPDRFAPDLVSMVPEDLKGPWVDPAYYMSHIFKPEVAVLKIQSWGFECMRSRRGDDGKFWETWYLPGVWAAKGDLRKFVDTLGGKTMSWEEKTKEICNWLAKRVVFGTLNVVVQRMALANPD